MSTSDPIPDPGAPQPALPPAPAPVPAQTDPSPLTALPPGAVQDQLAQPYPHLQYPLPGEPPRPPHPGFFYSCLWCIFFVLATQVPGSIVGAVIIVVLLMANPQQIPAGDLADPGAILTNPTVSLGLAVGVLFTQLCVIGFSLLVIRLVVGRDWPRQLAMRRPSLTHVLLVLAAFPALVLVANLFYEVCKFYLPSLKDLIKLPGMEEMVKLFATWPWPFAVLVIGLGPGIGEELWCRGFLGRGLVGHYGVWVGVLLSSFFFGLIHVDPQQGTMAMLMGIWLHFVYLTTRSLYVPMLLHFLNNSLAVLASHLPILSAFDLPAGLVPGHLGITALLLMGVVAWALYQSRARLVGGETVALWRPAYPGVELPPPGSGVRVASPTPSWVAIALVLAALAAFVVSLGMVRIVD